MSKDIMDFLNSREEKPLSQTDKEYFDVEAEYSRIFGHRIPTEILPPDATRTKIIEAMQTCISTKKDDLLSLLNVSVDKEYKY